MPEGLERRALRNDVGVLFELHGAAFRQIVRRRDGLLRAELPIDETDDALSDEAETLAAEILASTKQPDFDPKVVNDMKERLKVVKETYADHASIPAWPFDFKVAVTLKNPPASLRPGLNATADITTDHREQVVAIPIQAVVVREVASRKNTDAVIACGVILQGETNHAQNLSRSVTDALQRIAVEHGVPVINVVLSFDNELQARARCLENKINRGTEAARAAVEIANVMSDLRNKQGAAVSKPPRDYG